MERFTRGAGRTDRLAFAGMRPFAERDLRVVAALLLPPAFADRAIIALEGQGGHPIGPWEF